MTLPWFRAGRNRQAVFISLFLFALNAWICHRLFTIEFLHQLQSNDPTFASLSRFYRDHWRDLRWFPWFDGGMPIENGYMPLVLAVTAALGKLTTLSIERSYHVVLAFAYCCGPVTLFWFAYEWSESLALGSLAGILFSLVSPIAFILPKLRVNPWGVWAAQRLYYLIVYGEGPHVVTLALLPVALLLLRRAILQRGRWRIPLAVVSCAAVVLANAFGAIGIAIGAVCMVLALRRGVGVTALTGALAWLWISPWLSPSLIATLRANNFAARGVFSSGWRTGLALAVILPIFGALWWATRRLTSSFERFGLLFAVWMCAVPVLYFTENITLVPQANRYQLELEMAVCLLAACAGIRVFGQSNRTLRIALVIAFAILLIHQAQTYRNLAHEIIRPLDIQNTVEYKVTQWIDRNLPGQRVMVSGDAEYYFNVFSGNPQLSGGHEASAPNFMQQVAVYTIYTGQNAGDRDAYYSIFWLKAFGVQAITVAGPDSREYYHLPYNSKKFEGLLPVLWHEDGDTIYGVPQRSSSLAHVIPPNAVVRRQPVNGLDTAPARAYIEALDNDALPLAELTWHGLSKATIRARMMRDQYLSVQVTYNPAWHAAVGERAVPVRKDALGLMILEPQCDGDCRVDLYYGTTPEIWFCRAMSTLVTVALIGMVLFPLRRPQPPVLAQ